MGFQHPRHERVAGALIAIAVVALGCSTTHQLGRASDAATLEALEDAAVQPGAFVRVAPLSDSDPHPSTASYPIREVVATGVVPDAPGPAVVVPFESVRSISTNDRARGARKGALIGGIAGFVITGVVTTFIAYAAERNLELDGGSAPAHPVGLVIGASALGGLVGGLVGGGVGAMVGHEDRWLVAGDSYASHE